MPEFEFAGLRFNNPVELALHVIGSKWKMPILWRLKDRTWRYNELRRSLNRVTHKMLTQQLRELERDGLIARTVHPVVPPMAAERPYGDGETARAGGVRSDPRGDAQLDSPALASPCSSALGGPWRGAPPPSRDTR